MLHLVLVAVGSISLLTGMVVGVYGYYRYRKHCQSYEELEKIGSRMPDARARGRSDVFEQRIFPLFASSAACSFIGAGLLVFGMI